MLNSKMHPIFPRDFLFCLSLQAGVVGSSVIGITVIIITILINAYDFNDAPMKIQIGQYVILVLYLCAMLTAFILTFLASFWEDSELIRISAYILCGALVTYIVMAVVSLVPSYSVMVYVCPGMRCPDHHWLQVDRWRKVVMINDNYPYLPHWENMKLSLAKSNSNQKLSWREHLRQVLEENSSLTVLEPGYDRFALTGNDLFAHLNKAQHKILNFNNSEENENKPTKKYREIKHPSKMLYIIISVFYVLIYIGYLTYTILALLSFASQLASQNL